ncbi:thioredoxin family protein [Nocardioides insulae]|uniref:thioredoxin family protein n=1 Tax=Nocardioides insulae TaxID=394734 RepID=UPI000684E471|nr:thioredoxin family protein [Nocardioides insulae]
MVAPGVTTWQTLAPAVGDAVPGERATLVQFSSAFCAPCRMARTTLARSAALVPGVVHLEVDAERHLSIVRALEVRSTPTTLVLDAGGREVWRAEGVPSRRQVLSVLAGVIPPPVSNDKTPVS